jgi:hypothetical protein
MDRKDIIAETERQIEDKILVRAVSGDLSRFTLGILAEELVSRFFVNRTFDASI